MSNKDLTKNWLGEQVDAEYIVKALSPMLGWGSPTPWHVLERDIREKMRRLQELEKMFANVSHVKVG